MAFNHENMATLGLYPGQVTTQSVANLGHWFFKITFGPGTAGAGGGHGVVDRLRRKRRDEDKYTVTIDVRYKTKIWHYERTVSKITANVMAKLSGTTLPPRPNVEIQVDDVTVKDKQDPTIEVYKK